MELIPAMDLKDGRVVRLFQGDFGTETRYQFAPAELYARYVAAGAQRLHLVDLDGARLAGRGAEIVALPGGSIFCQCLATEFLALLHRLRGDLVAERIFRDRAFRLVKEIIRTGGSDEDLKVRLLVALEAKPERHHINTHLFKKCQRNMSAIGG